jgi:general secretion pathway protein D
MSRYLLWMLMLIIVGCAGTSPSFRKAQDLYAVGRLDEALAAYADAVQEHPEKAEYRMRLNLARHESALEHVKKGEDLLRRGDYKSAASEFRISQQLDNTLTTGADGLREAERRSLVADKLLEAGTLLRDRHYKQARQLLDEILLLIPGHEPALKLRDELDKRAASVIDGIELEVTSTDPITLNFKAASLTDVFDILTQLSGIRFILDEELRKQTTTLYLEGATFAQAFELLLRMNKLDKKILNSRTIILFPNSKDKQKQFSDQVIQTFYLSNIDAKKAVNLLRTMLQVRKIYVHEELNAIVLRDSPEVIRLAQKIIEANDRSTSEVVFDLELVEVSHTKDLDVGTKLTSTTLSAGIVDSKSSSPGTISGVTIVDNLKNLDFIYSLPAVTFNIKKQAGDAEILASPKIRVKNQGKAKVHIGSREPVVTVTINGDQTSENVQYVDVGVKLDIEPVVQLDNTIVTKLGLEVSNVSSRETTSNGTAVLTISTTNANTDLILKDGEQTIIGGLLRDDKSDVRVDIPILSDIPLIGSLFSNFQKSKIKREILLSITPHIVRALQLPESEVASIWSGGEDELRVGRNFGSFAEEYVEGQGRTSVKPQPSLSPLGVMPDSGDADAGMESQPLDETSAPREPGPPPAPMMPLAPPAVQPPPTAPAPAAVSESPAVTGPVVLAPAAAGSADKPAELPVAEVVLPPETVPGVAAQPTIFIEGDKLVSVGETLRVSLNVQEVENLFSAPLYVRFDPKRLEFVTASEGSFLKQNGQATIFTSTLMGDSGRLILGLKQGAGGSGASGDGVLAQLEFKALEAGKLSIAPERINFRNPAGERLPVNSRGLVVEVK